VIRSLPSVRRFPLLGHAGPGTRMVPISAQQFLEMWCGKLPEFFKNEAELRR